MALVDLNIDISNCFASQTNEPHYGQNAFHFNVMKFLLQQTNCFWLEKVTFLYPEYYFSSVRFVFLQAYQATHLSFWIMKNSFKFIKFLFCIFEFSFDHLAHVLETTPWQNYFH